VRSRIDSWLYEWAEQECKDIHESGISSINVVERLLRDPGGTQIAEHKVLWWPKNRRVARVSKASHQLTPLERIVLIIDYGNIRREDQKRFTLKDLARYSSVSVRRSRVIKKAAKAKLSKILSGYDNSLLTKWT
jgi:hypothetical protein